MFTALGIGNTLVKKADEILFLVELSFCILVTILSLTHCVPWVYTWVYHLIFLGLSFPTSEMETLERVMSKGLL